MVRAQDLFSNGPTVLAVILLFCIVTSRCEIGSEKFYVGPDGTPSLVEEAGGESGSLPLEVAQDGKGMEIETDVESSSNKESKCKLIL